MWSGPRNISTAMMRSFGSRSDCAISDEPFYGAFLKASGEPHPMAAEIVAAMDCDWYSVLAAQSGATPAGKPIWYQKHMPHHMVGPVQIEQMPLHRHAFLIRDPARMVASYRHKNELIGPEALGYARMRNYFEQVADRLGHAPPVIDADAVLANPAGILGRLCAALGIAWDPAMLHWRKGPLPDDGIWGAHWYDKVNQSNGFGPPAGPVPDLDDYQRHIADACYIDYEVLLAASLG